MEKIKPPAWEPLSIDWSRVYEILRHSVKNQEVDYDKLHLAYAVRNEQYQYKLLKEEFEEFKLLFNNLAAKSKKSKLKLEMLKVINKFEKENKNE